MWQGVCQCLEVLRDVGHAASDHELVPGGHDSFNSALVFENSDKGKSPAPQSARDESDATQIAFLEDSINTLLTTGDYGENDPIIVRLR
jgi:hypothetical protein